MSDVYESIVAGLQEAIEDAKSKEKKLPRRVVTVVPVKEYNASEVKKIRNETGMSQKTFASYLGVSCKTVEHFHYFSCLYKNLSSGTRYMVFQKMIWSSVSRYGSIICRIWFSFSSSSLPSLNSFPDPADS